MREACDINSLSSSTHSVDLGADNGFSVIFYNGDSAQVGWVKLDSVGTKLQVGSWAFQPGSDGEIEFGSTTDEVATEPAILRLQDFSLLSGANYSAKVGVQVLEKETLCYFVSSDGTLIADTATFNQYQSACEEMEPGKLTKLNTVNLNTFTKGSKYFVHFYALDKAGNLYKPWISDTMTVDQMAPAKQEFATVNKGPEQMATASAKFDEISFVYFAVYDPLVGNASTLSADSIINGTGALLHKGLYQYGTTYASTWEFGGLPEGYYNVAVVAEDKMGNRSAFYVNSLHFDYSAPVLDPFFMTANHQLVGKSDEEGKLVWRLRAAGTPVSNLSDITTNSFPQSFNANDWFQIDPCVYNYSQHCVDQTDYEVDVIAVDNSGKQSSWITDDNVSAIYTFSFTYDADAQRGPDTLFVNVYPTDRGVSAAFSLDEYNAYAAIAVVPNTGSPLSTVGEFRDMVVAQQLDPDTVRIPNANNEAGWEMLDGLKSETSYMLYIALHSQGAVSPAGERLIVIPFSTLDLTPPALSAPLVSDITQTGAKLALTSSEAGKIHYMVQSASAMMPNKASIVSKGKAESASAQTPVQVALSGLASASAFKVYAVAKDLAGNYSDVQETAFSTLSSSSSDVGAGGSSSSSSDVGTGGSSSSSSDVGTGGSSSSSSDAGNGGSSSSSSDAGNGGSSSSSSDVGNGGSSSSSSDAGTGGSSSSSSDVGNGGSSSSSSDVGNGGASSSSSSSNGGSTPVLGAASEAGQPLYYEVISTVGERVRQGALPPGQDVRSIQGLSRGRYIVLLRQGSSLDAVRLDVAE